MSKKKIEYVWPAAGSLEEALAEMPAFPFPAGTPEEERRALAMARLIIFYMGWQLIRNSKTKSLENVLARLGFMFLEKLPQLMTLDGKELPTL